MELQNILLFLLTVTNIFFTGAAVTVFLHCFHEPGYRWTRKKAFLYLIYSLTVAIFFNIDNIIIAFLLLLAPVAEFFIITYDYPKKKFRGYLRYAIIFIVFIYSITAICEGLLYFTNDNYYNFFRQLIESTDISFDVSNATYLANLEAFVSNTLNTVIFGFIYFYLYYRVYRKDVVIKCKKRDILFLAFYPILCILILTAFVVFDKTSNTTLIILTSMSTLFALSIPMFFYYSRISQHYRERTAYQESYLQAELEHFTQYKQAQEETRLFRHDIRNNLLCVSQMLQNGKAEEATVYLQELLNTSEGLRQKYVSGDEMLDCIIGVKAGVMAEKEIRFQLEGLLAGGLDWKPVDICSVFANALDNAIEACEQLQPESRYITMNIKSTPQFWFIRIENPVKETVDTHSLFKQKDGYTSKADTNRHGIGTYNMKHTTERNGGLLKAESTGNTFTLEIMLRKSNEPEILTQV